MRAAPLLNATLAAILLCLVLLIAQRLPARDDSGAGEDGAGRFGFVRERDGDGFATYDSQSGEFWRLIGHRTRNPLRVPLDESAAVERYRAEARYREPQKDTLDLLIETTQGSESAMMRRWSADQLGIGKYEPEVVVPVLIGALEDEDPLVVQRAAQSLARKPLASALPALREKLSHPDPDVVSTVEGAIEVIESATAP